MTQNLTMTAPTTHIFSSPSMGDLYRFIRKVSQGRADQLVGIYAPGKFAHPIIQQPADQPVYVSTDPDQVTQFGLPAQFGTIGLLAHNSLAGEDFFSLEIGSTFLLIYGDGTTSSYTVQSIQRFQALDPENPYSTFVDPQSPKQRLTSGDLFRQIYTRGKQVVFQTCIAEDGEASWGRIFIQAVQTGVESAKTNPLRNLATLRLH